MKRHFMLGLGLATFGCAATATAHAMPPIPGFPPKYVAQQIVQEFNNSSRFEGKQLRAMHVTCLTINTATLLCKGQLRDRKGLGRIVFYPRWRVSITSDGNQMTWRYTNITQAPYGVLMQIPD